MLSQTERDAIPASPNATDQKEGTNDYCFDRRETADYPILRLANQLSSFHLPRARKTLLLILVVSTFFATWYCAFLGVLIGPLLGRFVMAACFLGGSAAFFLACGFMATWFFHPYTTTNRRGFMLVLRTLLRCSLLMAVLVLPLVIVFNLIESFAYHVFHAEQTGVRVVGKILFSTYGVIILATLFSRGWGASVARDFILARQIMSRSAEQVMIADRRNPIVFLRSFASDDHIVPVLAVASSRWEETGIRFNPLSPLFWLRTRASRFEEIVCEGLSYVAPVVAIGQPGEQLPRLGAARMYVDDTTWKQSVSDMLDQCEFACVLLGSSMGLHWELNELLRRNTPRKILLLVPQDETATQVWEAFSQTGIAKAFGLPDQVPGELLGIMFCGNGEPVLVTGKPTLANYLEIAWEMIKFTIEPVSR